VNLTDKGVLCFSLHPGAVRTELMRYTGYGLFKLFPFIMKLIYPLWMIVTKSSKEGAQTTIYLAVEENISKFNGFYFRFKFSSYLQKFF
jgi:retinol dehydrogenase 12